MSKGGVHPVNINSNLTNNQQMIANLFNNYSLTSTNNIIVNNWNDKIGQSNSTNNLLNYMLQIFKYPFPNIKFSCAWDWKNY